MWKFKFVVFISLLYEFGIAGSSENNNTLWDYTASPEEVRNNHIESMKLYMNTSIDPCEDFYEYSCGNWKNANDLHSRIQSVAGALNMKIQQTLKEEYSEEGDNNEQAFNLFYKSCMNTELISERGKQPAIDFLKTFDGWPMVDSKSSDEYIDWLNLTAELALYGTEYILRADFGSDLDSSNEDTDVISIMRAFPFYGHYPHEIKEKTTFIMGEDLSDNILNEIASFEESFWNTRDSGNTSIFTLEELLIQEPHIDWERYLSIVLQKPINSTQKVSASLSSLKEIGTLLSTTPSRVIVNHLLLNVMLDTLYQLVNTNTEYSRYSTRDEYCASYTQNYFSKSLSKTFVDKYLDASANDRAKQLSEEIREAFSDFIGNIFWIDEPTKEIAKEKLNTINLKVGYTTKDFENYGDYPDLNSTEFFENTMKLRQREVKSLRHMQQDIMEDMSRYFEQYDMAAFYMRNENSTGDIYITSGMLQPPLFNNYIPNWSNYGGIGYIIGYEMTHGFNVRFIKARDNETDSEWWNPESFKKYILRTLCYNFQYDKYKFDDMEISIDGQKTLDENMADNGGVKFGYEAYKKWLKNHPDSDENQINPVINLSAEQLYFVSFAQTLCNAQTKDDIERRLSYDSHTPPTFRVIGAVSNSFDFARAFQCPIGSPMNPARKCRF